MAPDIEEVTNLLLEDKIWGAVQHHIAYYHAPEVNISPYDSGMAQNHLLQLCWPCNICKKKKEFCL
jgi:hypothetical protein